MNSFRNLQRLQFALYYNIMQIFEEHEHREMTSHMIVSHVFILIPCLWWLFGPTEKIHLSIVLDKIMACVLTLSIAMSFTYHYYYEHVLCCIETNVNFISIIILNLYMYFRNVSLFHIAFGITFLYFLQMILEISREEGMFEPLHPFVHYVAGFYIFYCVYYLRKTY